MTEMPSTRDQRPYNVEYYRKNRELEILRVVRRQRATLEMLRDLRRVPCADCGGTFPPYVMDFDHREPGAKSFNLTAAEALLKSTHVLQAEIAKCDIVCANCHRVRTYAAFRSGILRPRTFQRKATPAMTVALQRRRDAWHKRREAQVKLLNEHRARPCADCGQTYPSLLMDFDHRDASRKRYLVSQMPGRVKLSTLLDEIARCDVVCANCHRVRTYCRRIVEHARQLRLLEDRAVYAA
jgi:hypothetical protein